MPTKEKQDQTPISVKPGREPKVSREEIDNEIRSYLSGLPPSVDKLKEAADKAIKESRDLRMEARRTSTASQSGMKRVVPKAPQK